MFRSSMYADISVGEINRFLFIYLSSTYNEKVKKKNVLIVIVVIKIIMAIISLSGFVLDPDNFKCFQNNAFLCSSVRKNNIYWRTIPFTICVIITLIVSGYLIKTVFNQSKVSPRNGTICRKIPLAPPAPPPSPVSTFSEYEKVRGKGNKSKEIDNVIKRINSNPHMFFRLKINRQQITVLNILNAPKYPLLQNAKRALNVNLISLSTLLVLMPINMANIYTFFSDATCTDLTAKGWYLLAFSSFCNIVSIPFMIEKKLDKFKLG